MRKRPRKSIELRGKLFWDGLTGVLPSGMFIAESLSNDDPHQFGWRVSSNPPRRKLIIDNLLYVTAEAAVGLTAFMDALNENPKAGNPLELQFGARADAWASALGFKREYDATVAAINGHWTEVSGCYAHTLLSLNLRQESDVAEYAAAVTNAVNKLPEVVLSERSQDLNDLLLCVRRSVSEALLNVWQHAYPSSESKPVYVCLTVSPPSLYEGAEAGMNPEGDGKIREWFVENKGGLVLEIAVADRGCGIPKTLWRDVEQRGLRITKQPVWTERISSARAQCHQFLCEYAFDHRSTSKQKSDFRDRAALLSWRGWHRGMKLTAHLRGCIYVLSGLGRAGYAFVGQRMVPFVSAVAKNLEFPGTMAVIRLSTQPRRVVTIASSPQVISPVELDLSELVLETDVLRRKLTTVYNEHPNGKARTPLLHRPLGVVFAFKTISSVGELLQVIEESPPDRLLVLLLAEIGDEIPIELRANTTRWEDIKHGLPRLLALWSPRTFGFRWVLGGAVPIPSDQDRVYSELETQGYTDLQGESEEMQMLARELVRNYPEFLHFDELQNRMSIAVTGIELTAEQLSSALDMAFQHFLESDVESEVIFRAPPGKVIRLPSGRYVRAALSVLNMLRASTLLTESLRVRLNQAIAEVGDPAEVLLLVEGAASYLVVCTLLGSQKNAPRVMILGSHVGDTQGLKIVLFVDIFSRINTVRAALDECDALGISPSRVVACVDIRGPGIGLLTERKFPLLRFEPLLTYKVDPEEVTESLRETAEIIEWNAVTHTPTTGPSEFAALGTTQEREQFAEKHPELFRFGFQIVGERFHTVSLDTSALVKEHADQVVRWFADDVFNFVKELTIRFEDMVLFTRSRSTLASITTNVAAAVMKNLPHIRQVWVSDVPATPTSSKSLFPREEQSILRSLRPLGVGELLFEHRPPKEYLAVYLDDAAVTGDTLFDTVSKIANLPEAKRPAALVAVLAVNRLSPRETRFLTACGSLSQSSPQTKPLLFRFGSLFRLQVRSVETKEQTAGADLLHRMAVAYVLHDRMLQDYIQALQTKLSDGLHSGKQVAHLCCPELSIPPLPITTRAVRLRHLLALNQQHEGTIPDILHDLQHVVDSSDFSFLSVLALEPQLLRDDPLEREYAATIRQLCVRALRAEVPLGLKSDALTVLFLFRGQIEECLEDILPTVLRAEDLFTQFLVQLMAFCPRTSDSDVRFATCLDAVDATDIRERASIVSEFLSARALVDQRYVIKSNRDAQNWIHNFVATTSGHPGLYHWVDFDVWIKSLDGLDGNFSEKQRQHACACLDFAEKTLLPAVSALRWVAQQQRDLKSADQLDHELFRGLVACQAIRKAADSPTLSAHLKESWYQLKKSTLAGASPDSFLADWSGISTGDVPALEAVMPRFFCAPFDLFKKLAGEILGEAKPKSIRCDFGESVVVVQVGRSVVYDVFRQLLENVRQHAAPDTCNCIFELREKGARQELAVEIRDRQRDDDKEGHRRGMAGIALTGKRTGFHVDESRPPEKGGGYRVSLQFRNVIVARPKLRK